jgi:hypothetical protein
MVAPEGARPLGGTVSMAPRVLALAIRRMASNDWSDGEPNEMVRVSWPSKPEDPLVIAFECGWWVQMGLREQAAWAPLAIGVSR